jgi:hypothetical protein
MNPPKSITAACGEPAASTSTSTSRPMVRPSGAVTGRPRIATAWSRGTCSTWLAGGSTWLAGGSG